MLSGSNKYIKCKYEMPHDKVSANSATSVPRTSEFQDGHRVLKKGSKRLVMYVYGIQCNLMYYQNSV